MITYKLFKKIPKPEDERSINDGGVTYTPVSITPTTTSSGDVQPHTHTKSDITDFSHTHPYTEVNHSITAPTDGSIADSTLFNRGLSFGFVGNNNQTYPYGYGHLITFKSSNGRLSQLFFPAKTSLNKNIYFRTLYNQYSEPWVKIWNELNDGSGSGLDADKLDGYHAYEFKKRSQSIQIVYVVQEQYGQRANIDALQKDRFYLNAGVTDLTLNITNFNEGDTIEIYLPDSAGAQIYFSIFSEDGDQYAVKTTYPDHLHQNDYLITIKAMKNTSGLVAIIDFKELFNF